MYSLLSGLPAVAIEGPKAVGKTATAARRAATVIRLDDEAEHAIAAADPSRLTEGRRPIFIDEWQRLPASFDRVRWAVDDGAAPGSFLLAGSASPVDPPAHSGAGRIVRSRLRPMTLAERDVTKSTVSLAELLGGGRPQVAGESDVDLERYVDEILSSGFPGLRGLPSRLSRAQLDGYLDHVVDRDFEEMGRSVRRPATLRRWMAAYAAATATTATFEKIRDAATSGQGEKPGRPTKRLAAPAKHHLADPALAARLLGADDEALLGGRSVGPAIPRDGTLLGALFESLVALCVRVYAQGAEARTAHLRTWRGEREVDLIVERGQSIVAIEVKLGGAVTDRDVRHLRWLEQQIGDELADAVVVTTGREAYRRQDGIAVVPLALLGP